MQHETPQYETQDQHQHKSIPDEAAGKLGSAQPDSDLFDAVGGTLPVEIPPELIAAESRPVEFRPIEGIPPETGAVDFMTAQGRPADVRPREVFPTELR